MKVLHIIGGELTGGAAKGAHWLHKGLLKLGVDSRILTNSTETHNDLIVESIAQTKRQKIVKKLRSELDLMPVAFYKKRKKIIFSSALFGYDFTRHPLYEWADIINLHWINGGFVNIKHLSKVKKPIIWTMRDMWPMTGGCHYSMKCNNYENGCGYCEQLGSKNKYDLSWLVVRRKKKYIPKHIVMAGISNWISSCAKKSYLFKDYRIETLYNNIDSQEFLTIDKNIAKEILNIPKDKKIILAGAKELDSFYKGFKKYLEAIKKLHETSKYFLLFFGKLDKLLINNIEFEYKNLGYLSDTISLCLAYSAADVFVAPSIMEAFGKTLTEAMACSTPVVAFDATGPKDIINHQKNGYLVKPFDTVDLANGIEWVLKDRDRWKKLCQNAREKVEKEFDITKVAKSYTDLYEDVLGNKKSEKIICRK